MEVDQLLDTIRDLVRENGFRDIDELVDTMRGLLQNREGKLNETESDAVQAAIALLELLDRLSAP